MTVTAEDICQRAQDALSYFQKARGETGDPAMGSEDSDVTREDYPTWVMQIEEAARSQMGASWRDTHFYGLVAETLTDASEYGEYTLDEEGTGPEELIEELSTDISVSTYNEELVEWARQSSKWTDVSDDLSDYHLGDSEIDLELLPEGMSDDIRRLRYAVLDRIYQQLLDETESEPV